MGFLLDQASGAGNPHGSDLNIMGFLAAHKKKLAVNENVLITCEIYCNLGYITI